MGWCFRADSSAHFRSGYVLQRYRLRASGLGTLSAFGVGLTLGPLMTAQTRKTRVLASLVLFYFGVFLLLAGNRGAMLSAAVGTVLIFAGRMRWLLVGGVATALGVLLIMSGLALAGSGPGDHVVGVLSSPITDLGSIQRRVEFWDNLFFLLGDFRFTGVGLGVRSVQEIYRDLFHPYRSALQPLPQYLSANIWSKVRSASSASSDSC